MTFLIGRVSCYQFMVKIRNTEARTLRFGNNIFCAVELITPPDTGRHVHNRDDAVYYGATCQSHFFVSGVSNPLCFECTTKVTAEASKGSEVRKDVPGLLYREVNSPTALR